MLNKNHMEEEIADLYEIKQRYLNFVKKSSVDKFRNNFLNQKHVINRKSYDSTKIGIENNLVYFGD